MTQTVEQTRAGAQAAPRTDRRKSGPAQMGAADLKSAWRDGQCSHGDTTVWMDGLCATYTCNKCDMRIDFVLRFGRPKKFDVFKFFGDERRLIGRAPAALVRRFMLGSDPKITRPVVTHLASIGRPNLGDKVLLMLTEALDLNRGHAADGTDFCDEWRSLDCRHETVKCRVYGDLINVTCIDCEAQMSFRMVNRDVFNASLFFPGMPAIKYGSHGPAEIVSFVREFAGSLELPGAIADRMSDDPDRDARRLVEIVSVFESHGILHRMAVNRDDRVGKMAGHLSAAVCTRREFERRASGFKEYAHYAGLQAGMVHSRAVAPTMLETAWLTWPHWFEGDGVEIREYDPAGGLENCIRCGFSTLDDDGVGAESWKYGCVKCGYNGHLLGLDGQADSRASYDLVNGGA